MLPDSNINEPASHGFIEFKIATLFGIVNSGADTIRNKADIFFDFNIPVRTNTVKLGSREPNSVRYPVDPHQDFVIAPNPASTYVNVLSQSGHVADEVTILDLAGKVVTDRQGRVSRLDISGFGSGLYFVRIRTGNTFEIHKFVKM